MGFYAAHPLFAPGGEAVGTLCIVDTEPRSFDEAQSVLPRELACWVQTELIQDQDIDHAELVQRAIRPKQQPTLPG